MERIVTINFGAGQWSTRARFYAIALALATLVFFFAFMVARGENAIAMNLPLTCSALLFLGLATSETCLLVRRSRQKQAELDAARIREQELQQRIAIQQHQVLNQISRA